MSIEKIKSFFTNKQTRKQLFLGLTSFICHYDNFCRRSQTCRISDLKRYLFCQKKKKNHIKARYTLDIFARNIAIKRCCDEKIKRHFSSNIFFPVCIENIFWDHSKCNYNILKKKYLFIKMSF
jgi:hypothetical protein